MVVALLVGAPLAVSATANDYKFTYRDEFDASDLIFELPQPASGNLYFLGEKFNEIGLSWWKFSNDFSVNCGGSGCTVTLNSPHWTNIGELTDNFVSTSTLATALSQVDQLNLDQWNAITELQNSTSTQANWSETSTSSPGYIQNKPALSLVATSGSYTDLTNKPTRTYSNPSRSLNTAFQVSTTQDSRVRYSVRIANTLTLSGGAAGDVVLEYADNSGFTTNVKEVGRVGNGNTGTLVVGLTLNDAIAVQVDGEIPAGKYVRLRTSNTTGTPTYTILTAQEVTMG